MFFSQKGENIILYDGDLLCPFILKITHLPIYFNDLLNVKYTENRQYPIK